ncbi:hypothetical protein CD122_00750 [Staphylococcus rostri]|uniref:Uncharacterized protein n=1 Tax=Staphylococcus rostri TaxID=522262 RepID=A0A2K3YYH8_9STAP|nr:hypothetical protein CD122_00750 [Staphylococcus rostri]
MEKVYNMITTMVIVVLVIVTMNGFCNSHERSKAIINMSAFIVIILLGVIAMIYSFFKHKGTKR